MQVLLYRCQIPPFGLRWLQIVWSIGGKRLNNRGGGLPPHMTGRSSYTHTGITALIIWDISVAFPYSFHLRPLYVHWIPVRFYIFCLSYYTGTHHTGCVHVMPLPFCFHALPHKMLCSLFSFVSLPAVSPFLFHLRVAAIPCLLALLSG